MILDVLIEARLAGRLDLTRPEHPVFAYDTAYARDGDATPLSTLFPPAAAPPEGETLLSWLQGLLPPGRGHRPLGHGNRLSALSRALRVHGGYRLKLRCRLLGSILRRGTIAAALRVFRSHRFLPFCTAERIRPCGG